MFYSNESFIISGVPKLFKGVFLDSLEPKNDEQEKLIGKMRVLLGNNSEIPKASNGDKPVTAGDILRLAKQKYGASSLVVLGTVGNGKTTLACAMVNSWNRDHGGMDMGLYRTMDNLVDEYKAEFDNSVITKYSNIGLLVVDELNPKSWSEYNKNLLQKILVSRHASGKKTVLIGNLSGQQLKEMFDEHIISRMREGVSMIMQAPDMREACGF